MKRLLLLGVGHTHAHVLRCWEKDPLPGFQLSAVSNFPHANYSGMLPGVVAGQFAPEEFTIDLTQLCRRAKAELIVDETLGFDPGSGRLQLASGREVRCDILSIGVGSVPTGLSGLRSARVLVPIKPMQTFQQRLATVLAEAAALERSRYKIAVVGGGAAGIEIAFGLHRQLQLSESRATSEISLFTADERLAADLNPRSLSSVSQLLQRRGIEVHLSTRVVALDADKLTAEDGRTFDADAVVWATGASAPPVLAKLGLPLCPRGFIATNTTLQSVGAPQVFAVGDCGSIVGHDVPKAGVFAVRQGPVLWHNLQRFAGTGELQEFRPQRRYLKLLNTADGRALAEYGRWSLHARACWWLKKWIDRSFIAKYQH